MLAMYTMSIIGDHNTRFSFQIMLCCFISKPERIKDDRGRKVGCHCSAGTSGGPGGAVPPYKI